MEAGALSLASAEVRFMLDSETHDPLDVAAYEMRETNELVRGRSTVCVRGRAV
jgi:exosome complex exonuclease DIS3/RRP44